MSTYYAIFGGLKAIALSDSINGLGLIIGGLLVNNMYYWATNRSIIQRAFGARNLKEAQKGAVFAGFLKIMTPLIIVVPGVICALAYPGQNWGNGNSAYPMLVS